MSNSDRSALAELWDSHTSAEFEHRDLPIHADRQAGLNSPTADFGLT